MRRAHYWILSWILLGFLGCSTPQKRAEVHSDAFAQLSPQWQSQVLRAQIELGMNEDAVFIALGEPAYKKESSYEGEAVLGWYYMRLHHQNRETITIGGHVDQNGNPTVVEHRHPVMTSELKHDRVVFFKNGIVVGMKTFDYSN